MKNPLVLFVGAAVMAVAAVAVLAGVAVERWDDRPAPPQSTTADADFATDKAQEVETAAEKAPAEDVPTPAVVKAPIEGPAAAPEQLAAAPAAVAVAETVAPAEKIEPAELAAEAPASAPAVKAPERLAAVDPASEPEPDPAPEGPSFDVVRMEDDGSLLAVGRAQPGSEVALILDGQVIATMPADDAGEWLIMPDQPLPPGSHELTVESSDAAGAGANPGEVVMLDVPEREEKTSQPEPVVKAQAPTSESDEERVALAPLPEQQETEDAQVETPADAPEIPLTLDLVDYSEDGAIVFSGRAQPGLTVGIYVDNRFAGETTVGLDGRWEFTGGESIAPGRHTLRADLRGPAGSLSARIILPFVRADSRDVAALVESRREPASAQRAPEPSPPPAVPEIATEASEAEIVPEVPVVAEEVTPEPEEPAVAESAAPEPEPESEAKAVAEPAAPEPEPEATAVAQPVAPEPESEVAEATAPESQPEVPVVTAPAPEPELGPELETPAVAMVDPEREPDSAHAEAEAAPVDAAPEVAAADDEALRPTELKAAPLGPGHVVIQPGNNLWRISRVIYGRGIEYMVIYQANRDRIRDPDLIYPGQIFATPGVRPPQEIDPDWRDPLSPDDLARRDIAE